MATVNQKIFRTAKAPAGPPSEVETTVCQALIDLESHIPELKMELRPLQVSAVKEVEVKGGKKAYVVFVPMPQLKACLLYTSPSPRDRQKSRMPSSA